MTKEELLSRERRYVDCLNRRDRSHLGSFVAEGRIAAVWSLIDTAAGRAML